MSRADIVPYHLADGVPGWRALPPATLGGTPLPPDRDWPRAIPRACAIVAVGTGRTQIRGAVLTTELAARFCNTPTAPLGPRLPWLAAHYAALRAMLLVGGPPAAVAAILAIYPLPRWSAT